MLWCSFLQITSGNYVVRNLWILVVVCLAAAWPNRCTILWNIRLLVLHFFSCWGYCPAFGSCWSDSSLRRSEGKFSCLYWHKCISQSIKFSSCVTCVAPPEPSSQMHLLWVNVHKEPRLKSSWFTHMSLRWDGSMFQIWVAETQKLHRPKCTIQVCSRITSLSCAEWSREWMVMEVTVLWSSWKYAEV